MGNLNDCISNQILLKGNVIPHYAIIEVTLHLNIDNGAERASPTFYLVYWVNAVKQGAKNSFKFNSLMTFDLTNLVLDPNAKGEFNINQAYDSIYRNPKVVPNGQILLYNGFF